MIRKILLLIAVLYGVFVAYANIRFQNPSTQLAPVDLKTFRFAAIDSTEAAAVKSLLLSTPGIRAVSMNEKENLIGVTYEFERISDSHLLQLVSLEKTFAVEPVVFSTSGPSCPVHGVIVVWEKALAFHRFVD